MRPKELAASLVTAIVVAAFPLAATGAEQPNHDMHEQHAMQHAPADSRPLV